MDVTNNAVTTTALGTGGLEIRCYGLVTDRLTGANPYPALLETMNTQPTPAAQLRALAFWAAVLAATLAGIVAMVK